LHIHCNIEAAAAAAALVKLKGASHMLWRLMKLEFVKAAGKILMRLRISSYDGMHNAGHMG